MVMVGLRYDLRHVPGTADVGAMYRTCVEQCVWGDQNGVDYVVLSEHHGAPDGFMPAPMTMAAAIAGSTSRIGVTVAALLLPLHDPVRVAEQMVTLDLLSGGRVSLVVGAGYRPEEFEMAGVDRSARGRLVEEYIGVLRSAWTGEPFEWRGRTIHVTPKPMTSPHPTVMLGGSSLAAASRAGRLGLGFFPAIADPALGEAYTAAALAAGHEAGFVPMPSGPGFVHVTNDPERDWARLAPYVLHDATAYAAWQTPDVRSGVHVEATDIEGVKASGVYRVVTPDECVELANELGPFASILLHPLLAGMPAEMGWSSLELFAAEVAPRLPR
jgi:alkanesulfonate monooxygenase SsuD/methylene tetrahydromethanopterin reductase-like flavin-dependent oxidoreductase (luciferase family)